MFIFLKFYKLHHLHTYWFQLIEKTNLIRNVLLNYARGLKRSNKNAIVTEWLKKQQDAYKGLPCELLNIRSLKEDSDKCVGYRNKCEFTIGKLFWMYLYIVCYML